MKKEYDRLKYVRDRKKILKRVSEWAKKNPQRKYLNTKKSKDAVKVKVFNHYGNKCSCCPEKIPLLLTIDHINNDGNKHKDSTGHRYHGHKLYSWLIKNNFPPEYQTLCWSCNMGKHLNKGVCPHKLNGK